MRRLATAIVITATAAPMLVLAQAVPPWYLGVGIGQGHAHISGPDVEGASSQVDDKDTAYTLRLGYRITPYVAAEVGYYDLGRYGFRTTGLSDLDVSSRARSAGVSLVGTVPINAFDLYGRAGYARTETKSSVGTSAILGEGDSASGKHKENEAIYGLGARWNGGRQWGVFAEWMRHDKIEVDTYFIGVDFRF